MAKLKEWIALFERIAPLSEALSFDNPGLNIGDEESEVDGVLLALDATEETIVEAKERGCNLLVSHHPLIFSPLRSLTPKTDVYKPVVAAVRENIAVYAMHTNYDCVSGGLGDRFAAALELRGATVLLKTSEGGGIGRIGDIDPMRLGLLAGKTQRLFGASVRVVGEEEKEISRVAVVNGAGADAETVYEAFAQGAQALISAEVKHHVALYARSLGLALIESGHYATERFALADLASWIEGEARSAGLTEQVVLSRTEQDPFNK